MREHQPFCCLWEKNKVKNPSDFFRFDVFFLSPFSPLAVPMYSVGDENDDSASKSDRPDGLGLCRLLTRPKNKNKCFSGFCSDDCLGESQVEILRISDFLCFCFSIAVLASPECLHREMLPFAVPLSDFPKEIRRRFDTRREALRCAPRDGALNFGQKRVSHFGTTESPGVSFSLPSPLGGRWHTVSAPCDG